MLLQTSAFVRCPKFADQALQYLKWNWLWNVPFVLRLIWGASIILPNKSDQLGRHTTLFSFSSIFYIYLIQTIISSWSFDLVTGNGPQKMGRIYEAWSSKMESSALICKCSGQTNTKAHLAGQVKKYWFKIFGGNILSSPWDVFILPPIITP